MKKNPFFLIVPLFVISFAAFSSAAHAADCRNAAGNPDDENCPIGAKCQADLSVVGGAPPFHCVSTTCGTGQICREASTDNTPGHIDCTCPTNLVCPDANGSSCGQPASNPSQTTNPTQDTGQTTNPTSVQNTNGGFVPLAAIPGLTDSNTLTVGQASLANFLNNLYKFLIGIAAALAVIMIVWAGIEIAVNKEDVSKMLDSRGKIVSAVFGLILVLAPALVFGIINPSILNLSLNLPPITEKTVTANTQTTPCTPNNGTHLIKVTCPDSASASAYSCPSGFTPQAVGTTMYCKDTRTSITYYMSLWTSGANGQTNNMEGDDYGQPLYQDYQGYNGKPTLDAFTTVCGLDGGKTLSISELYPVQGQLCTPPGQPNSGCPTNPPLTPSPHRYGPSGSPLPDLNVSFVATAVACCNKQITCAPKL